MDCANSWRRPIAPPAPVGSASPCCQMSTVTGSLPAGQPLSGTSAKNVERSTPFPWHSAILQPPQSAHVPTACVGGRQGSNTLTRTQWQIRHTDVVELHTISLLPLAAWREHSSIKTMLANLLRRRAPQPVIQDDLDATTRLRRTGAASRLSRPPCPGYYALRGASVGASAGTETRTLVLA